MSPGCKNIGEVMKKKHSEHRVRFNGLIKAKEVELRDEDGNNIGVVDLAKALRRARQNGVDLVEADEKAVPPVCVLIDFGKFMYRCKHGSIPKYWQKRDQEG